MEAGSNNHIIVVGDFMIDRSWVVNAGVPDTVQAHGDVKPMKRIKPSWNSDRLGGAGIALTALQAMCRLKGYPAALHGLGIWSADDKELMERLARGRTESATPDVSVQLHRLQTTSREGCMPITTIKARFYSQVAEEQPQLIARYDQDPDETEPKYAQDPLAGLQLPPADAVRAVLIADFNKGTVQPELIGALARRLQGNSNCVWLLDSKRPGVFQELRLERLDFFTCNRDEMFKLLSALSGETTLPLTAERSRQVDLLTALNELVQKIPPQPPVKYLVAKFDRDGACVCDVQGFAKDGDNLALVQPQPLVKNSPGIAAGDFFNASLVLDEVRYRAQRHAGDAAGDADKSRAARIGQVLVDAARASAAWLRYCEDYWKVDGSAARFKSDAITPEHLLGNEHFNALLTPDKRAKPDLANLTQRLDELNKPFSYVRILEAARPTIQLGDAKGFLGDFSSTDLDLRSRIAHFVDRIKEYSQASGRTKPLNCLVVADPGSGKSFFVQQIAQATNCEIVEVNCSQVLSNEDLMRRISGLQNVAPGKTPLLFLDEVDTKVEYYPYLLAPLWDAAVFAGERRAWLPRTVSILVASKHATLDKFVESLHSEKEGRHHKGLDLLSRLNGPRLTLSEPKVNPDVPTLTSRVYMAGSMIVKYQSSVFGVQRGLFDLIFCAPKFSARVVENWVAMSRVPDDGVVKLATRSERLVEFAGNLGYRVEEGGIRLLSSAHSISDVAKVESEEIERRSRALDYKRKGFGLEQLKQDVVRLIDKKKAE
jgi:hypothetical protein